MEEKKQNQEQGLTTEEVKAQIAEVITNAKENREKVRKERLLQRSQREDVEDVSR